MMTEAENEEAHALVMEVVNPDAIMGSDSITFEYSGVTYELETLLEVVVFVNKYLEGV